MNKNKYVIEKIVSYTYEITASDEQKALEMLKNKQATKENVTIKTTEIQTTPTLDELAVLVAKAEKELAVQKERATRKRQEVVAKESAKWEEIKAYIQTKIIPILSKHNSYYKICKIADDIGIYRDNVNGVNYWKIAKAKDNNIEKLYFSINYFCLDEKYSDHSILQSHIVRNWDSIKPSFEKELVATMTEYFKKETEKHIAMFNKYSNYDI